MQTPRDNLVLIAAFAVAITLHIALLPWVGEAVGEKRQEGMLDLVVRAFKSEPYRSAGQRVGFKADVFEVQAEGESRKTRHGRFDAVWLSMDAYLDQRDLRLETLKIPGMGDTPRDEIEVEQIAHTTMLPSNAEGPYWLIYQADVQEQVPDPDRSNNTRVAPIYIDGPQRPELAIETFNAPDHAVAGGSILIDFAVYNLGDGWASSNPKLGEHGWADRLYLSTDDRLDATDLPLRTLERTAPLGPKQGYRHEHIGIDLPRGMVGHLYLILAADTDQLLDQPSFIKGLAARPIELIDTNRPDLGVATISNPNRLVIGRPAPIAFTIANLGSVPTVNGDWTDGVYLSRDGQLDDADLSLASLPAGQPLKPFARYESALELTLPQQVEPGDWYLIVKADAADAIDEAVFEDNNAFAVPIEVWTQAQADAQIKLGSPDRPERLVVQWIDNQRVEEHIARRSRTVQPALQSQADPDPNAPLIDNPKPPSLAAVDSATGSPNRPTQPTDPTTPNTDQPPPDATATDLAPRPQAESSPTQTKIDGLIGDTGDLPAKRDGTDGPATPDLPDDPTPDTQTQDTPTELPGERDVPSPADPNAPDTDTTTDSETPADTESDTDSENPEQTDSQEKTDNPTTDTTTTPKPNTEDTAKPEGDDGEPAAPSEEQTPTRAPKDESEAPPTDIKITELELQEGEVLVGKGIKVTTKLPTPPGTGSRVLSIPRNARVSITFDNKGKVFEAKVIRSTTYPEWDAAIEASLYRWSAEGEAIDNAKPHVTIEWDYLLNDLFDGDE